MGVRTAALDAAVVASRLEQTLPGSIEEGSGGDVLCLRPGNLLAAARWLRDDLETDLKFLSAVSGVDWQTHFEVVYHLFSLARNHELVLKVRLTEHESPSVPSVVPVWYGAHLQEREVYDLMGIHFEGHPDLRRVFLWEGFPGHPLRKDFLAMPGGLKPGLAHFPKER